MAAQADIIKIAGVFIEAARQKIRIDAAYLFGSWTTGGATDDSDIDIAIVSPDFTGFGFEDRKKLNPVIIRFSSSMEIHPFRKEDFTDANPFAETIRENGIRIA